MSKMKVTEKTMSELTLEANKLLDINDNILVKYQVFFLINIKKGRWKSFRISFRWWINWNS